MGAMGSQVTRLTTAYSTVYPGARQRKHQSFAPKAFVRGIHRWPVNSPHKRPVTHKMFPFDDVIMVPGSGNCLAPNRQKVMIWTNDGLLCWLQFENNILKLIFVNDKFISLAHEFNIIIIVIMRKMPSQITSVSTVCTTVCSGTDQRKHRCAASLAFVRRIHRWPVNSPQKGPATQKMFPFDDVIMMAYDFNAPTCASCHVLLCVMCKLNPILV